jgi:hypothetical protein
LASYYHHDLVWTQKSKMNSTARLASRGENEVNETVISARHDDHDASDEEEGSIPSENGSSSEESEAKPVKSNKKGSAADDAARKAGVKAMSKKQRDKKRRNLVSNKNAASTIQSEILHKDADNQHLFEDVRSVREDLYRKTNGFLHMWFASSMDGANQTVPESNFDKVIDELSLVFHPLVAVSMPEATSHFSRPSQVEFGRNMYSGLSALLTYTEGYDAFCVSLAKENGSNMVSRLLVDVLINPASLVVSAGKQEASSSDSSSSQMSFEPKLAHTSMSNKTKSDGIASESAGSDVSNSSSDLTATAKFRVSTVNAILCGGLCEFEYDGEVFRFIFNCPNLIILCRNAHRAVRFDSEDRRRAPVRRPLLD